LAGPDAHRQAADGGETRSGIHALEVKLSFLGMGKFSVEFITDGKDSASFATERIVVKDGGTVKIPCLPRGGFVGVLTTQTK
jgi:hypothetical protein